MGVILQTDGKEEETNILLLDRMVVAEKET